MNSTKHDAAPLRLWINSQYRVPNGGHNEYNKLNHRACHSSTQISRSILHDTTFYH